ncbi:MAG: DUF418 domain-containing protein [Prevotellaceae bacterium]|jgi:uncharacterized protein|nr:DUF418 domain-containing protein [Prevotellaceae bacterium]
MNLPTTLTNDNRIKVADVLRGFAVMGITLIHFIERFSLYSFPKETCQFLVFTDKIIWDSVFFTISGKAYCIFALLFGFSFFIQDNSQKQKGRDFRGRFAWRLLLLLGFACINSTLFPGEILVLYALVGYVLIAVCRLSSRSVLWIAAILLIQPIEIGKIVYALANSGYAPGAPVDAPYWDIVNSVQKEGSFLEMCTTAIWTGNVANMGWMLTHGRILQTAAMFMLGMVIGRSKTLTCSEKNLKLWLNVLAISITTFFVLYGLNSVIPDFISREAVLAPLSLTLSTLANAAFTGILFAGIILLYYLTRFGHILQHLAPYGRMSFTNYLSQSLIGGFLFYNWGLGLYRYTGITACFFMGIGMFLIQLFFSRRWMRSHRQGPLEWLWKKATWIKTGKR